MTDKQIQPHRVTKPIQLLAAWLVGLIVTNTIFLAAATNLEIDSWERGALVVSSIVNVPLFLLALFVLQTRFRAELQEDTFYSEYLSKKTAAVVRIDKNASQDARIDILERQLSRLTESRTGSAPLGPDVNHSQIDWAEWPVALNILHPQFQAIRETLRAANIPLADIFGNKPNSVPPEKWIIALSHHLPFTHKARLLEVLLPYGFDGIQFWEPQREVEENEDVYIGSYGVGTYARVTPELLDLVRKKIDAIDLTHYYNKHKSKLPEA